MNEKEKKRILKERADILRIPQKKNDKSGEKIDGLEFLLAEERYAIDSTYVSEVIFISEMTTLPCTPPFVLGIINVRGKILSVIDIKKFFNLPEKGITNLNKVIIVKHNEIELGILADEIYGNVIINLEELQRKVTTISEVYGSFIIGVSNERLILLDIKELLSNEKIIINENV